MKPSHGVQPVVMVKTGIYGPQYTAAIEENGTVWSVDCTHLHHTPDAARKCFAKVLKMWAVWGALPRNPIGITGEVVEMQRRGTDGSVIVSKRMAPMRLWGWEKAS